MVTTSRAPTSRLALVPAPQSGGAGTGGIGAPAAARSAFDQLYAAHARYVAGLAGRMLGRDDEVADVVQDVFLIAHRGIGSLRDPGAARSWLSRIAVREASRRLRWRRVRSWLRPGAAIDHDLIVDSRAAPEMRPLAALLYATLDRMPIRDRLPWILHNLADENLETIAEICASSVSTVKRRIAAADRRLHHLLHDEPAARAVPASKGGGK